MSHTGTPAAPQDRRADVELRLPADSVYVSVLRTTTAALAARLDFTLDDIEDLRMSVGEACAIVLPQADPAGDLLCGFEMAPGELTVSVGVPSQAPAAVDEDSFGWQVLTTLATAVHAEASGGRFVLTLTVRSLHADLDG
jgi:serine/threonine-protein kinase RsbW